MSSQAVSPLAVAIKTEPETEPAAQLDITPSLSIDMDNGNNGNNGGRPGLPVLIHAPIQIVGNTSHGQSTSAPEHQAQQAPSLTARPTIVRSDLCVNPSRRLLVVVKPNAGMHTIRPETASAVSEITCHSAYPPPPPLKRMRVAERPVNEDHHFTGPSPCTSATNGENRYAMDAAGGKTTSAGSTPSAVKSVGASNGEPSRTKKKKKRRPKPRKTKDPTPEEIERLETFKRLFRAQSESDISDTNSPPAVEDGPAGNGLTSVPPTVAVLKPPGAGVSLTSVLPSAQRGIASPSSTSSQVSQEALDQYRLHRMRNNEAVRRSRLKARMRIKQSELNCRILVKQFGELKERIQELENQLQWERKKNELLEEMLQQYQSNTTHNPDQVQGITVRVPLPGGDSHQMKQ